MLHDTINPSIVLQLGPDIIMQISFGINNRRYWMISLQPPKSG